MIPTCELLLLTSAEQAEQANCIYKLKNAKNKGADLGQKVDRLFASGLYPGLVRL